MYFGKKVQFRLVELSDVDYIMEHFNDLELRSTLAHQLPMAREEEESWVRSSWEKKRKGTDFIFSIVTRDTDEWIGTVGLHGVDRHNRRAELGIAIMRKDKQGKGYGTDAVLTMCGFAFQVLGLHSVMLRYIPNNVKGKRAYEKVGFTEVGRERECIYIHGKFHDLVTMDILREEFDRLYPDFSLLP